MSGSVDRPTLALIHGGSFTGAYWRRVLPLLEGEAFAVDLPGRGAHPADLNRVTVADWVGSVVDEITRREARRVILVGHSLAGITMPGVARALPDRVVHVVYSSCTVPGAGERAVDLLRPDLRALLEGLEPLIRDDVLRLRPGGVSVSMKRLTPRRIGRLLRLAPALLASSRRGDLERDDLLGDSPDADAVAVVEDASCRVYPEALKVLYEPSEGTALPPGIRSTYVRNARDALVLPTLQDAMILRIGDPTVVALDAPHCPELVAPARVAAILNDLAAGA